MSPVATGKLSRLSSCINGENTAISTIRVSTIFGILLGIRIRRRRLWKVTGHPFIGIGDCGDYSIAAIKCNNTNFSGLEMRLLEDSDNSQIPDLKLVSYNCKMTHRAPQGWPLLDFLTKYSQIGPIRLCSYIFLVPGSHYICSGHAFPDFEARVPIPLLSKPIDFLLDPAMELVPAGKESGGASGDISTFSRYLMHWER